MAFEHDMPAAAHRHLDAGDKLIKFERRDVAGYLFGLAAECAVKAMATRILSARRDEIFYTHFPELRVLLKDALQGREAQRLRGLIEHDGFMNGWHVRIRYARAADLKSMPVETWRAQAAQAINLIGGS